MRNRRFRPGFDLLGSRITPSDVVPYVNTGITSPYNDGCESVGGVPGGDVDLLGTVVIVSGANSGFDPMNPPLN